MTVTLLRRHALNLALLIPGAVLAAENTPALDSRSQQAAPTAFAREQPLPKLNWGTGDGRSYLIPLLDILGEEFLLNQYDRNFDDPDVYGTDFSSFKKNLNRSWVSDSDPFDTNQFLHPYQGSMYHGFARSAGLDFWDSFGYAFAGSALWELAGETEPASINDQYTTSFGGSFLGEPLFRMASLLLESSDSRKPSIWRELGAAALSPSTGFNRNAFGERFDGVFRSNNPAVSTRIQLGVNLNTSLKSNVKVTRNNSATPVPQSYEKGEAIADFMIAYGLPGKPDYSYTRPFDNFNFQFTAASGNVFENIISRGLLLGTDYAVGDNYRGVWGVYGTYDYIAPQIFRVSTTGAALGTTYQWWLSRTLALQGTVLAGVGYGSAGTIHGEGERDYHSGVTAQGLLASRLIFSDKAVLEMELRDYGVSGTASDESGGSENIARGAVAFTVRVHKLHGIMLKYTFSQRDARYSNLPDTRQDVGAISIGYSYLGQTRFGSVDWRPKARVQGTASF